MRFKLSKTTYSPSYQFPLLSDVVNNLFDTVESEENEHGRIVVKKSMCILFSLSHFLLLSLAAVPC